MTRSFRDRGSGCCNGQCCPGPCCEPDDRCCNDPDRCCNDDNPCCGSEDPCCNKDDPCCGSQDECCNPDNLCCGSGSGPCCFTTDPCCNNPDPCCPNDDPCDPLCGDPCICLNCDDGIGCTVDQCSGGTCIHNWICEPEEVCCAETTCCAADRCCANGECCSQPCEECLLNGELSGGTVTVDPPVVCIGGTIRFTASGVTDTGGVMRVDCSAKRVVDPVAPTYTWEITKPDATKVSGTGPVATVVAAIPGAYGCTFTATAARECPPQEISIEDESGAIEVRALQIDATSPSNTVVSYEVIPPSAPLDSATFYGPSTIQTLQNPGSHFSFSFDQKNLTTAGAIIRADVAASGTVCGKSFDATRQHAVAPALGTEHEFAMALIILKDVGIVQIPVEHSIFVQFDFICYSIPTVVGSKTLWVGRSSVNIQTLESGALPNEIAAWVEDQWYETIGGAVLPGVMTPVTYPTMPAQGPHFRSADRSVDAFFAPNDGLAAIGQISVIAFDDPAGDNFAYLVLNAEVDIAIEGDSMPPAVCPPPE